VTDNQTRRHVTSRAVTACGVEHVRLSYAYLECDDIDGYSSLLDDDVILDRPGTPLGRGRAEVVRMLLDRVIPRAWHALDQIIADGDRVAVIGRLSQDSGITTGAVKRAAFVDVFTLSETGMLRGCRRYYFSPPA
jgi:ketosteroid isomerase-like protein